MNAKPSKKNKSLISSPILWGLMSLSFGFSLTLAYFLDIRFDEAFTLNTTSQGVFYAFNQALRFEQQAPLYFVLLSLWRKIDSSIFFARLFSVLFAPFIIWASTEVAKRYVKNVNPFLIAAVIAVHQQLIWSALEIRLYTMMMLLSVLLLLFFYDGYLSENANRRSRILYIVVSIISLYTQYYLGFQLAAGAGALLLLRRWRTLLTYILDMAIVGVLFAPMLFVIKNQVAVVGGQTEISFSIPAMMKDIYQRIVNLFISTEWIHFEFLKRWFARVVILAVGVLLARKIFIVRAKEDVALCAIVVVLVAFFCVTYFIVGEPALQPRHMNSLVLPLALLPFSALSFLKDKRFVLGWFALIVFLNVGYLYVAYKPMAKPGDFRRIGEYLMANEKNNQPILIFHADAVLPLSFYYKGKNNLVAVPQKNNFNTWNPRNNVLKDEKQILDLIDKQPDKPERFWLVQDGWCAHGGLSLNCNILEDVVEKYFVVESTKEFLAPTKVRLLRRKTDEKSGEQ